MEFQYDFNRCDGLKYGNILTYNKVPSTGGFYPKWCKKAPES